MPTDMKCPVCGKITRVPQARIRANKSGEICCSKACANAYKQRRVNATCKACGKAFDRPLSNAGDFCSHTCALEWRWNQSPESASRKQKASERGKATSSRPSSDLLRDLYANQGLNYSEIGAQYGVKDRTVYKWLKADGFTFAPSKPPRTKVKYLSPPENELRNLYEAQRLTAEQVGERFGVSRGLVLQWLRRYGIQARPSGTGLAQRGIEPPTCEELTRMIHTDRLTYAQIAVQYGVDQSAVMHWLNKHGIERPLTWFEEHSAPETLATMRAAYESGASLDDIGQYWGGVVGTTVNVLFKAHGIPLRSDGWKGGQRFACQDGHLVRSTYERRVDDWLHEHGVEHIYEPSLPFSPMHKADFLANGWYIEVWGVTNNQAYQERKQRKSELYATNNAPLIEIPYFAFSRQSKDLWIRRLHQCLTRPS